MRKPAPARIIVLTLASAIALVFAACANPDTQTPTCVNNVGDAGLMNVDGGCEGFAICIGSNGHATAAVNCCVGDAGAFTGNDLATCLYGFADPSCPYLVSSVSQMGMDVVFTCSTTPPPSGGTGGSTPSDGGADG
jgi:hypothetical protein